jgi:hypothetical protein
MGAGDARRLEVMGGNLAKHSLVTSQLKAGLASSGGDLK